MENRTVPPPSGGPLDGRAYGDIPTAPKERMIDR
jgi:hypothetical protein